VGDGRKLVVEANGASRLRKYVQSATLDGKAFNRTWLPSRKVHAAGRLRFEMGVLPNRSWGTGQDAAPPGLAH
jgi:putative alpha-1,2-mannosidase